MSTNSESLNGRGRAIAAALMAAWLSACAVAWDGSAASGGDAAGRADAVAYRVSRAFRLTPGCTALARGLAEASIRAKAARMRPTARLLKEREDRALDAYAAERCPAKALVGIAFGAAEAVRAAEEARSARSAAR